MMKRLMIPLLMSGAISVSAQINPDGVFSHAVGGWKIHVLPESQQLASPSILIGATAEMLAPYASDGIPNAVNAILVQTDEQNILVDTGFGRKLFDHLAALGLSAADVDILLLTHMHGDHVGGMLRGDALLFPDATVYVAAPEAAYWQEQPGSPAARVLEAYAGNIQLFTPGAWDAPAALLPGIQTIAAFGHTPGHTMYLVENSGGKFLIWGDLAHAMAIQMPHPEIAVTYDLDPAAAIQSRLAALQQITAQGIPVAGMHIAFPGTGKITPSEQGGYSFTPAAP